MKHKRTHKEIKIDSQDHYGGLAENNADQKARERFKRPAAYQSGRLIRAQGAQLKAGDADDDQRSD